MTQALFERANYPGLNDCIYLNQASLGLIGQPAVQSMHDFLDHVARHGNIHMSDADEIRYLDALRESGARLLNCHANQIAILGGASELLGQLPFMIQPDHDSNIVAIGSDFPAVTRPWIRYADQNNCELRFVDDLPTEDLTDRLIAHIDVQTAVVAVSFVQFSTGSIVDISSLQNAASDAGAKLIVDVTQAAGILKIDFESWNVDAVIASGYKWLGGHGGVALAAVAPWFMDQPPPLPGWMGTGNPFNFEPTRLALAADARRFTLSTLSYISITGLVSALNELVSLGAGSAENHARSLARELVDGLRPSGWTPFRDLEDPSASPHIIALSHPEIDAETGFAALLERRIVSGIRNGRIRISLAPYNDSSDILAVIKVLSQL